MTTRGSHFLTMQNDDFQRLLGEHDIIFIIIMWVFINAYTVTDIS